MAEEVYSKLTDALSVLHKAGYLHLNLKPDNVMIFRDGNVRFMDTDSFIDKTTILNESTRIVFSRSRGYTALELEKYRN